MTSKMTQGLRDIYSEKNVKKNIKTLGAKNRVNICNGSKVTAV